MGAAREGARPAHELAALSVAVFDDAASVLIHDRGEGEVAQVALERVGGRWRTVGAATVGSTFQGPDGGGFVVATSGAAPTDAQRALIEIGGRVTEAPVEGGLYHFARRFPAGSVASDPESWPRLIAFAAD